MKTIRHYIEISTSTLWMFQFVVLAPLFFWPNSYAMGNISSIELVSPTIVCDSDFGVPCGISEFQKLNFSLHGVGKCGAIIINFGDGESREIKDVDFDAFSGGYPLDYLYGPDDWGGQKTVVATGVTDCSGEVSKPLTVLLEIPKGSGQHSSIFKFAVGTQVPWAQACRTIPGMKKLPAKTLVKITGPVNDHDRRIDFGCWFAGCIYDADGSKGSKARDSFPFPGYRDYSLILRVGSQIVQGGTDIRFTTTNQTPSDLEFCLNDENLSDNSGQWFVKIEVDESQAVSRSREPVSCFTTNTFDGQAEKSVKSQAIYFTKDTTLTTGACVPDGTSEGDCRIYFGGCSSPNAEENINFKVFDDGGNNVSEPYKFLWSAAPGKACGEDSAGNVTCRRWFGMASTTDGRHVQCYLFNDGMSNLIGPTDAIYYRQPGQVCMPDGSSAGACRKWFGNCEVVN